MGLPGVLGRRSVIRGGVDLAAIEHTRLAFDRLFQADHLK